jgi:dTDP-4-amino-4,6-dideoxygalactose transaminase
LAEQLALYGGNPVRARSWPDWPEFGEAEQQALQRVLESRNWGGHPSPNVEAGALSREFAAYVGSSHAVPTLNGTISLTLALQAARVSPGAEVITTAYTFVGTASAIVAAGCVPVFVDVLEETYCLDPDQVEAAVGPRTEAIMPVHLACSMADLDRLEALARRRGLLLVEDCAHAHGACWRGRGAGSIGGFGSFSMQSTKLLTAGEGGMITTSDEVYEQRLQSLLNCGRKEPGYDRFPERMLGTNARMTEWQAALLRAQLRRLPEQHERRSARLEDFEKQIVSVPGLRPLARDERVTRRAAYQFILRYDAGCFAGVPRDDLILALRAEGVPCAGRFYVPIPEDPLFAMDPHTNPVARNGVDYSESVFPVTSRAAYQESIWLPHSLFLGDEDDVKDLVAAFAKVHALAANLRERLPQAEAAR